MDGEGKESKGALYFRHSLFRTLLQRTPRSLRCACKRGGPSPCFLSLSLSLSLLLRRTARGNVRVDRYAKQQPKQLTNGLATSFLHPAPTNQACAERGAVRCALSRDYYSSAGSTLPRPKPKEKDSSGPASLQSRADGKNRESRDCEL